MVVFLDVRGFSSFAGIAESTDTAEFLKTVYIKILDDYFRDAEFFKPTGDGLLILLDYNRENLQNVVQSAVARSIKIVEAFPGLCQDDEMVNFDVPTKLGIGLARGSATSLTADGKTLDFSGRPLNLASRLMDLARPSGIVFDERFGFDLLENEVKKRFSEDAAYVKGLAESKPMKVYCLEGFTEVPEYNKRPLDGFVRFTEPEEKMKFKSLQDRGRYRHPLSRAPARTDNMELHLRYPKVTKDGSRHSALRNVDTLPATFRTAAGKSFALVDYGSKIAELERRGVKGTWMVSATLEYSIVDDSNQN